MLSFVAFIYGKITDVRNTLYDRGVFESFDLGVRTISIGNITAGGTGKTPLVAYVARLLADGGEKVCILTRGYGRDDPGHRVLVSDGNEILADPRGAGDEPFELARNLLERAIVIADVDRVAAGDWAKRKYGVTAFVLDDGFQHRKVKRDVDIVCVDATDPFGGGKMLPAGRLRERPANLGRANIVVITRATLAENIENLKSEISEMNPAAAIFVANNQIISVLSLEEFHAKTLRTQSEKVLGKNTGSEESGFADCKNTKAFAFCGIGNPESFFAQLRQDNFDIAEIRSYRDHQIYTQKDVEQIEKQTRQNGAKILLTTAKDAVKLAGLNFALPCFVVETETAFDDAASFAAMI